MNITKVLVGDVGVYLCRCDICVAKERLHGTEVGSVTEEVRCEAVAEFVWSDFARDT